MRRYLLHVGYCGTRLRGIQKQTEALEEECGSIHGLVEKGLARLDPASVSQLYFSSRTDKGVHAVCNTAHVDLSSKSDGLYYDPSSITHSLNRFFKYNNIDIRIHKTTLVPSTFHSRYNAVARRYLYRLAVTPRPSGGSQIHTEEFMPTAEIGRLYLVRPPFDVERLEPVCRMLEGTHDFASFANAPAKGREIKETVREIHSVCITPGRPLMDPSYDPLYSQLQFWDVTIRASGFLYKQVRRTVGALVGVAQGRVSLRDIQCMLDEPSHKNWISAAVVAAPDALYLLEVEYPPSAFCKKEEEEAKGESVEGVVEKKEEVVCESKREVACDSKGEIEGESKVELESESRGRGGG